MLCGIHSCMGKNVAFMRLVAVVMMRALFAQGRPPHRRADSTAASGERQGATQVVEAGGETGTMWGVTKRTQATSSRPFTEQGKLVSTNGNTQHLNGHGYMGSRSVMRGCTGVHCTVQSSPFTRQKPSDGMATTVKSRLRMGPGGTYTAQRQSQRENARDGCEGISQRESHTLKLAQRVATKNTTSHTTSHHAQDGESKADLRRHPAEQVLDLWQFREQVVEIVAGQPEAVQPCDVKVPGRDGFRVRLAERHCRVICCKPGKAERQQHNTSTIVRELVAQQRAGTYSAVGS